MDNSSPIDEADKRYLKSLSILYVEDEDEVRDQLKTYLTRRCRHVYTAANGKKGLEAYQNHEPDIIVTDILMPVMDGLKMSECIRETNAHIPIIITTAFEEPRYFHQAIDIGVNQYVTKPVRMPILESALLKSARILRSEAALKEIEERYHVLFKLSHIAISIADAKHDTQSLVIGHDQDNTSIQEILIDCNQAFLNLLGYENIAALQCNKNSIYSLMNDASAKLFNHFVQEELLVRGFTREFEIELIDRQQNKVPVLTQLILRYSETGEPMETWGVMRDIREQRKNEESLRLSSKVFESSRDAIIISDAENSIISVNQAFTEITGYDKAEAIGKNPSMLQSGRHDPIFYQQLWSDLTTTGYWQGEIWNRRKNGEIFPEWISVSLVYDIHHEISHFIAIFSDITHLKDTEADIEFLANYDPLTKLPNRRLFVDRLDQSIKNAAREKTRLAVLFFDLDHFKDINDSLGHSTGDLMLIEVGNRINSCMRESDSVSRLSGDEFAAVINDIHDIGSVITVVQKIIDAIRLGFKIHEYELHVTISIGISVYPNDGDHYELLLKNADTAMYCSKHNGRDNFEFFSPSMSSQALERLALEGSLRKAVEDKELQIFYQPQIQIETGKIIGMEALLRWKHPNLGMIPPNKFIPLAEETGLILPIGNWVLEECCRQNKEWQDKGLINIPISINLSAVQFRQHNLFDTVQQALISTGLRACYLELELTENMLMDCSEYNVTLLKKFRQLGVSFALDDFGTGYSSLSYLSRFPISRLKIDESFVIDIPEHKNNAAIISAAISLGHDLGMTIIAEGVETKKQFNYMQAHQCDEIQGHLFSQAVPKEAMEQLLEKNYLDCNLL